MDDQSAVHQSEPLEVDPAQALDAGTLTTSGAVAQARVTLRPATEAAELEPSLSLRRPDHFRGATPSVGRFRPARGAWS